MYWKHLLGRSTTKDENLKLIEVCWNLEVTN